MTQEEKQLLLIDLCARAIYRPFVQLNLGAHNKPAICILTGVDCPDRIYVSTDSHYYNIANVKPYLRPMSSMTEDEKDELHDWGWVCEENNIYSDGSSDTNDVYQNYQKDIQDTEWLINWLNAHHFDYHGLIEKGLALEALDEMYKRFPSVILNNNGKDIT